MARARARDAPRPVGEDEFTPELRIARLEAAVGALGRSLFGVYGGDHLPTAPLGRQACQQLIEELAALEEASV